MTPKGIEPATFRLVSQCFNQLRQSLYSGLRYPIFWSTNNDAFMEATGFSETWHPLHFCRNSEMRSVTMATCKQVAGHARCMCMPACVAASRSKPLPAFASSHRHAALLGTRKVESVSSQLISCLSSEYNDSGSRGCPIRTPQ